jgi:nitroreductase / dihydropteridine reductase
MSFIEKLNWRYAVKKFDVNQKLSTEQLTFIKEAIKLTPSSFGLQPFKVLVIQDQALKEKLKPASWNQSQITDCSELFVFTSLLDFSFEHVDHHILNLSKNRAVALESLEGYRKTIQNFIAKMNLLEQENWTSKQIYIALGNMMAATAAEKIDVCPIEGFEKHLYDEILNLKSLGLKSVVAAAVGFRASDDKYQFVKKVRKANEDLFLTL